MAAANSQRANIGNAKLAGFEKDLKLKGYEYNILLTSFYISYIFFEIPSNIACKYFGPGKWIPFISFGFGVSKIRQNCCLALRAFSPVAAPHWF